MVQLEASSILSWPQALHHPGLHVFLCSALHHGFMGRSWVAWGAGRYVVSLPLAYCSTLACQGRAMLVVTVLYLGSCVVRYMYIRISHIKGIKGPGLVNVFVVAE